MNWRISQAESRSRYLSKYNSQEAALYDSWVRQISAEDNAAYLDDLRDHVTINPGMKVLDAGAGTGGMSVVLATVQGIHLTALEPCIPMLELLKQKPELHSAETVTGFSDSPQDQPLFQKATFDLIVSRQLVNGLYDPLTAFRNWHHWLKPTGTLIVTDGFYGRSSWTGQWEEEVDVLPISASQSLALIPYLLEQTGFRVQVVSEMTRTNLCPSIRTKRFLVIAQPTPAH